MSLRRFVVAASVVVLLEAYSAAAQEVSPEPTADSVPNWTAPPFWTPPQAIALEKPKESGALEPMGVDAVPTGPLPFFGITPCRLVDTTKEAFGPIYGPPALIANTERPFDLNSAPTCPGIPANAQAYSLNITAAGTQGPGFIVIYPQGGALPVVSTLNYVGGQTIANAAIVPAGTGGGVTVIAGTSGTHLIIDINGYYAPIPIVNTIVDAGGNAFTGNVSLFAGSNISIVPAVQGFTISNTAPASWSLTGNTISPGQFLGSTNDQAVEIRVNGDRAMRLVPHATSPNVIGGRFNSAAPGVFGAGIGGGGSSLAPNRVTDSYGTVAGGQNNQAGDNAGTVSDRAYATVGGGLANAATGANSMVGGGGSNRAAGAHATVGGGLENAANFPYATVSGGSENDAQQNWASVGGGRLNTAAGMFSTVPGGDFNFAGHFSFAAGRRAKAAQTGAFVWGDSTDDDVVATGANQFIVRASGGAKFFSNNLMTTGVSLAPGGGSWSMLSDRQVKENIRPVDSRDALDRLAGITIETWNYRSQDPSIRHMGPMAQDFHAAFGLGEDDRHITTIDANGVALAAVQALYEIVKEKNLEIEALRTRLSKLESKID